MVQMEHGSKSLAMPVSEMHMKMESQMPRNPESHNFHESTEQRGLVLPLSLTSGFTMVPNNSMGHDGSSDRSMDIRSICMPNQLIHGDESILHKMAGENTSFPVKRKAEVGSLSTNSNPQHSLLPSKWQSQIGIDFNSHGLLQPSEPQKKTVSAQPKFGFPVPPIQPSPRKTMVRNESMSGRSGLQRGQTTKKETVPIESISKGRPESLEAVRSKMKESLAAALALQIQNQGNDLNTEKNPSEAATTVQPIVSETSESNSTLRRHVPLASSKEASPSKDSASPRKTNGDQGFSAELPSNRSTGVDGQSFAEFEYSACLPDDDISFGDNFFFKDDLLLGHGLSWAFDFDVHMRDGKEDQHGEKPMSTKEEDQGYRGETAIMTPENLALKIEAELFKIFGDVNKKYREKGRSLLFNLKDRNNPELRERVMSGEISPEKLCSMSAEELASKELSQWRMAKAEELAQMVVLPDTEVDIRRLVRKTHKGEYQVEVEHDDGIAADVSGGTSMLTRPQSNKEIEPQSPFMAAGFEDTDNVPGKVSNSEERGFSGSMIIPTDGTDLMQGMMVDELKNAGFLPPIVSLDEFMKSLDSEPPFESLSKDAGHRTPASHGESPKLGSSRAANQASDSAEDASSRKVGFVKKHEGGVTIQSHGSPAKIEVSPTRVTNVQCIWDGVLKLSVSSSVTVGGIFQSGERTSTKEWPSTLEIKGRVRLDAFEKFLKELPMSRTRAVMVLHFVLKDKSANAELTKVSEAIEAYLSDQRLGYAEPVSGVELYLCPRTSRIIDILNKQMPEKRAQIDNSIEKNDLIGIIVWRRAHKSDAVSPNLPSHHKHNAKGQLLAPSKRVQDSSKVISNNITRISSPLVSSKSQPQTEEDDDDDIPPGFGPGVAASAAKDDDDLPEYNLSGDLTPQVPRISSQNLHPGIKTTPRPVDQVRELIKMYGQSGTSSTSWVDDKKLGIEPWKDDDDDDMPEWKPEAPHQLHPVVHGHWPRLLSLPTNQHMASTAAQQSPSGLGQPPPVGRWVQPPAGPLRGARWR